ncbi:hypothetical protein [Paenibacillus albidus]|uniref:hypothetical protein n=1 Tax=Paenibacillus albidus TaxID=2041023 RepID=UPI00203644AC|nr:hypothetical protein [Paenibacillus albidus]
MEPAPAQEMATLPYVLQEFDQCVDLLHRTFPGIEADLVYFDSIIDSKLLASEILEPFTNVRPHEVKELLRQAPVVAGH